MFKVFGFYKFIKIKSLKKNKEILATFINDNNIRGTVIIAKEGLNGTISGRVTNIEKIKKKLSLYFLLKNLTISMSQVRIFNLFINQKLK